MGVWCRVLPPSYSTFSRCRPLVTIHNLLVHSRAAWAEGCPWRLPYYPRRAFPTQHAEIRAESGAHLTFHSPPPPPTHVMVAATFTPTAPPALVHPACSVAGCLQRPAASTVLCALAACTSCLPPRPHWLAEGGEGAHHPTHTTQRGRARQAGFSGVLTEAASFHA